MQRSGAMGELIRSALPDPVSYYETAGLALKGPGKWRSALCVFHDEESPSLRINTESGGFCCMGCGAKGGDVLSFHMQANGMDFIHAAIDLEAWISDDKPYAGPRRARKLPAADALELAYQDINLGWVLMGNIRQGVAPSDKDFEALGAALRRLYMVSQEAAP